MDSYLVVVRGSKFHAQCRPGVEVSGNIDRAAATLAGPNTPELLECLGPINRWLLRTGRLQDLVRASVCRHATLHGRCRRGIVCPEVLDNVVLNEWATCPAVDRKIRVTSWIICCLVIDDTAG